MEMQRRLNENELVNVNGGLINPDLISQIEVGHIVYFYEFGYDRIKFGEGMVIKRFIINDKINFLVYNMEIMKSKLPFTPTWNFDTSHMMVSDDHIVAVTGKINSGKGEFCTLNPFYNR